MSGPALTGTYHPALVLLSVVIAIAASYAALDLAGRVRKARSWTNRAWLAAAAVTMGGGIWSMHFVAMLAFQLPMSMAYDARLTAISLALPVFVTGLGFAVVRRRDGRPADIAAAGLLMGGGVAAMHYTGMAAMRMPARLEYDGVLVAISVLIAIVAATLALWLSLRDRGLRVKLGAAVAMGLAVAGMHYTAMAAAQWTPQPGIVEDHHGHDLAGLGQTALALSVAAATFLILVFALAAALFDRRFALLAEREAALALRESEARLRLALEGARLGTWEIHVPSGATTRSDRLLEIAGFTDEERAGPHASWRERIHPEDVERAETALAAVLAGRAEAYRVEYRLRRADDGRWVWIESHGAVVEREPVTGVPQRVAGTAQDITERREAEERRVLLAREVDHRAKNALAVVQTMLRLTRADDVSGFRKSVEGRVAALARAQTLLAEERWVGAGLRTLVRGELAPFVAEQRLDLNGPQVVLPPLLAQPLAMALHELATNAAKYGALSVPEGRVSVSWRLDTGTPGTLALRWMETGGPPVTEPPSRQGFGSRVLKGTVGGQLGGKVSLSWQATGLVCDMQVPLGRVAASAPTEALCAG